MFNAADNLPFPVPDDENFEIEITIRSRKYDCHTSHRLNKFEIKNDKMGEIMRCMTYRLKDFIDTCNQEKSNAISKGTKSKDEKRFLN